MYNTSECNDCTYCEIRGDKSRLKVWCDFNAKEYYYGQHVACENKVKCKNCTLDNEEVQEECSDK